MTEPPSFDLTKESVTASEDKDGMCAVTSFENTDKDNDVSEYAEKALRKGYSESLIKEALTKDTSDIKSFSDFEKLLDSVINESDAEALSAEDKKRIRKSYSKNINKFFGTKNPIEYLQDCISGKYKVHPMCVTVLDILEYLKNGEYSKIAKLDIFESTYEALCAQWDSDWVDSVIKDIQQSWENNDTVLGYISTYVKDNGDSEESFWKEAESLVPTSDLNYHNLPVFKKYLIIQRHLLSKGEPVAETDSQDLISCSAKGVISCDSKLLAYMNSGVPASVASMLRLNEAVAKKERETGEEVICKNPEEHNHSGSSDQNTKDKQDIKVEDHNTFENSESTVSSSSSSRLDSVEKQLQDQRIQNLENQLKAQQVSTQAVQQAQPNPNVVLQQVPTQSMQQPVTNQNIMPQADGQQQVQSNTPPVAPVPDMTAMLNKSAGVASKVSNLKRSTQIKLLIIGVGLVWSLLAMIIRSSAAGIVCLLGFGMVFSGSVVGKKDMRTTAILVVGGILLALLGWKF